MGQSEAPSMYSRSENPTTRAGAQATRWNFVLRKHRQAPQLQPQCSEFVIATRLASDASRRFRRARAQTVQECEAVVDEALFRGRARPVPGIFARVEADDNMP